MVPPRPIPVPPGEPAWDICFTRLAHAMQPRIDSCVLALTQRFQSMGFGCDRQVRQTPRGLSTLLAVVGQRGLLFIVDITLIDGMAVNEGRHVALDIRLLDACGDVVAEGLAQGQQPCAAREAPTAAWALPEDLARAATSVYVAALGHFELLQLAR
jgi:hypothetical protein